jgi:hypothetical protein
VAEKAGYGLLGKKHVHHVVVQVEILNLLLMHTLVDHVMDVEKKLIIEDKLVIIVMELDKRIDVINIIIILLKYFNCII